MLAILPDMADAAEFRVKGKRVRDPMVEDLFIVPIIYVDKSSYYNK